MADGRFLPPRSVLRRGSLNGLNFLTGCFLLPESHKGETPAVTPGGSQPARFVPVGPGHDRRRRLMAVFFIMQLVGQVPAALWVIFGEDRFHWDATTIGISLAAFGILHSLAQAMITGL